MQYVQIKQLSWQKKKAILSNIKKLAQKYGFDNTRLTVNKYFQQELEKRKLEKEVQQKEAELKKLKNKL